MAYSGILLLTPGDPVAGYEKLTVTDTAVSLTVPANANRALMVLETAKIRIRDDETDPTASEGLPLNTNQSFTIDNEKALHAFKAIRTGGTSGVLYILYYKK